MRRRVLTALLAVLVLALCAAAVAVARSSSGGNGAHPGHHHRHGLRAAPWQHRHPGGPMGGPGMLGGPMAGMVLDSLAQRLGVDAGALKDAVRQIAQEQWQQRAADAGLTQAEIDALKACHERRPGATCDRQAVRSAFQKLRSAPKPDLAALKAKLAQELADKLGKTPDDVLSAVRAELSARLDQAVAIGFITPKGRDLALACFDDPASCDLQALRAEVRFGPFAHHHGPRPPMPPGPPPVDGPPPPGAPAPAPPAPQD